jgi:hypothetical protein
MPICSHCRYAVIELDRQSKFSTAASWLSHIYRSSKKHLQCLGVAEALAWHPLRCVSSVSGSDRRPAKIEPKIDTGDDCLDVLRDLPCVRRN